MQFPKFYDFEDNIPFSPVLTSTVPDHGYSGRLTDIDDLYGISG